MISNSLSLSLWDGGFMCIDPQFLQLELNLERLRMAVDDLLMKLAKLFAKLKSQMVFLINNYDMTISVLKVTMVFLIFIDVLLMTVSLIGFRYNIFFQSHSL